MLKLPLKIVDVDWSICRGGGLHFQRIQVSGKPVRQTLDYSIHHGWSTLSTKFGINPGHILVPYWEWMMNCLTAAGTEFENYHLLFVYFIFIFISLSRGYQHLYASAMFHIWSINQPTGN